MTIKEYERLSMTFGEMIAARRRQLGISQKSLAESLNVSPGYLSKVENGTSHPSKKMSDRLTEVLQLDDTQNVRYTTGNTSIDLDILEKRVSNAIYEMEIVLNIVRELKGERV